MHINKCQSIDIYISKSHVNIHIYICTLKYGPTGLRIANTRYIYIYIYVYMHFNEYLYVYRNICISLSGGEYTYTFNLINKQGYVQLCIDIP
jgi:hypothetical protein